MKIIKPLQISCFNKTFTYKNQHYLSIGAVFGFNLLTGEDLLEQDLWGAVARCEELDLIDKGMPKPLAEYLLYGQAHTPDQKPIKELSVKIQVDRLEKSLLVKGESYWQGLPGFKSTGSPMPFTSLPLTAQHSYGGEGYPDNPLGKGYNRVTTPEGEERFPCPSIQLTDSPQTNEGSPCAQAYTSAMDLMNPKRQSLAGTYDDAYQRNAMPGLPDDFDWLFNQEAPKDQRFSKPHLPTDCSFKLHHLNHEHPVITGKVPQWKVKTVINKKKERTDSHLTEVLDLVPETLIFLPNQLTGLIIFRNTTPCLRNDGKDISHLVYAIEDPKEPRETGYYLNEYQERTHPEKEWLLTLDTQSLLPAAMICGFKRLDNMDMPEMTFPFQEHMDNYKESLNEDLEKQKKEIEEATGRPLPPEEVAEESQIEKLITEFTNRHTPLDKNGDLDFKNAKFITQEAFDELSEKINLLANEEIEAKVIPELEALLKNPDLKEHHSTILEKIEALRNPVPDPWPRFSSQQVFSDIEMALTEVQNNLFTIKNSLVNQDALDELEEQQNSLLATKSELLEAEQEIYQLRLVSAEQFDRGAPISGQLEREEKQREILEAIKLGRALPTNDLSDMFFENENFDGIDLSNCMMEGIKLHNVSIKNAKMNSSLTIYSELIGCDFSGSDLSNTNLGSSKIENCKFDSCNLSEVIFNLSKIKASRFEEAVLEKTQWEENLLKDLVFDKSNLSKVIIMDNHFDQCSFHQARLEEVQFMTCQFTHCDFSEAEAKTCNFIDCDLEQPNFSNANLENARFLGGCKLSNALFVTAHAKMSSFNSAKLESANFEGAQLSQSDFQEAELRQSNFKKTKLHQANFADADCTLVNFEHASLMEARLYHTCLVSANFSHANLYSANLLYATYMNTCFDFANLDRTLLERWKPDE